MGINIYIVTVFRTFSVACRRALRPPDNSLHLSLISLWITADGGVLELSALTETVVRDCKIITKNLIKSLAIYLSLWKILKMQNFSIPLVKNKYYTDFMYSLYVYVYVYVCVYMHIYSM